MINSRKSFTLIEMVVSILVAMIVVFAAGQLFGYSIGNVIKARESFGKELKMQYALEHMTARIRSSARVEKISENRIRFYSHTVPVFGEYEFSKGGLTYTEENGKPVTLLNGVTAPGGAFTAMGPSKDVFGNNVSKIKVRIRSGSGRFDICSSIACKEDRYAVYVDNTSIHPEAHGTKERPFKDLDSALANCDTMQWWEGGLYWRASVFMVKGEYDFYGETNVTAGHIYFSPETEAAFHPGSVWKMPVLSNIFMAGAYRFSDNTSSKSVFTASADLRPGWYANTGYNQIADPMCWDGIYFPYKGGTLDITCTSLSGARAGIAVDFSGDIAAMRTATFDRCEFTNNFIGINYLAGATDLNVYGCKFADNGASVFPVTGSFMSTARESHRLNGNTFSNRCDYGEQDVFLSTGMGNSFDMEFSGNAVKHGLITLYSNVLGSSSALIRDNYFSPGRIDQNAMSSRIEHNDFYLNELDEEQDNAGPIVVDGGQVIISGNRFLAHNGKCSRAIYLLAGDGDVDINNNMFQAPCVTPYQDTAVYINIWKTNGRVDVYNNIFWGDFAGLFNQYATATVNVYNNTFSVSMPFKYAAGIHVKDCIFWKDPGASVLSGVTDVTFSSIQAVLVNGQVKDYDPSLEPRGNNRFTPEFLEAEGDVGDFRLNGPECKGKGSQGQDLGAYGGAGCRLLTEKPGVRP